MGKSNRRELAAARASSHADCHERSDSPAWTSCIEADAARWIFVVCQALAAGSCIQAPQTLTEILGTEPRAKNFLNLISGFGSAGYGRRHSICRDFVAAFRNVLGPLYVELVAESVQEAGKFSLHLAIPFTQHKVHQQERLAVALQCANHRQERMEVLPLGLYEVESLSGQHIFEGVKRVLHLMHLSWENLMGVSISGERLEKPSRKHLLTLLREKNPQLVVIPRLCRVLSSSITAAISTYLGEELLVALKNMYDYFQSGNRVDVFMEFCKSEAAAAPEKVCLDVGRLKDPIITKEGYVYPILRILGAYHSEAVDFFQLHARPKKRMSFGEFLRDQGPHFREISHFLSDDENIFHLIVLNDILMKVSEVVDRVETNQLGLLDLGKAVKEIIRSLMEHVIPAGDSNVPLVLPDDLLRATHYDPDLKIFYNEEQSAAAIARGQKLIWLEFFLEKTTLDDFMEKYEFMRRLDQSAGLVRKGVLWRCRKVVLQLIHDLENEYRDVLDLLDLLETMKPTNLLFSNVPDEHCKGNIQKLAEVLHGPFVDPDFVDKLAAEVRALHHYRAGFEVDAVSRQKPDRFWFEVKEVLGGTIVDLPMFALDVLTLPHCGGSAEYALNLLEIFQIRLDNRDHRMSQIMLNARLFMDAADTFSGTHNTSDKPFPEDIVDRFLKGQHSTGVSRDPSANIGLLLALSAAGDPSLGAPPNEASWTEVSILSAKESLKLAVAAAHPVEKAGRNRRDRSRSPESEDDDYGAAGGGRSGSWWNGYDSDRPYRPYDEYAPDDYYDSDEDRRALD